MLDENGPHKEEDQLTAAKVKHHASKRQKAKHVKTESEIDKEAISFLPSEVGSVSTKGKRKKRTGQQHKSSGKISKMKQQVFEEVPSLDGYLKRLLDKEKELLLAQEEIENLKAQLVQKDITQSGAHKINEVNDMIMENAPFQAAEVSYIHNLNELFLSLPHYNFLLVMLTLCMQLLCMCYCLLLFHRALLIHNYSYLKEAPVFPENPKRVSRMYLCCWNC